MANGLGIDFAADSGEIAADAGDDRIMWKGKFFACIAGVRAQSRELDETAGHYEYDDISLIVWDVEFSKVRKGDLVTYRGDQLRVSRIERDNMADAHRVTLVDRTEL